MNDGMVDVQVPAVMGIHYAGADPADHLLYGLDNVQQGHHVESVVR
jgi:hypothetical protein